MKKISISKTFIIILIVLIAMFISGSYLMGNMAEKNLNHTVRQLADKGINISKYHKGIFSSSLSISAGPMSVAKIHITHMPIIINYNNLFNKKIFILQAFGDVKMYNSKDKVSSQEILVNLNGNIDTRFKIYLSQSIINSLKVINGKLEDNAITGSLMINASSENFIKARLQSSANLNNLNSNIIPFLTFKVDNLLLNLNIYIEKDKSNDDFHNKTVFKIKLEGINLPSIQSKIDNITADITLIPQTLTPALIAQTIFVSPWSLLNLINTDININFNDVSSKILTQNNSDKAIENINFHFAFNGYNDNIKSKLELIFKEINTKLLNSKFIGFQTALDVQKSLIFKDLPDLLSKLQNTAINNYGDNFATNPLNITPEEMNNYLLKIQSLMYSLKVDQFSISKPEFGNLTLNELHLLTNMNQIKNNIHVNTDVLLKNLEWSNKLKNSLVSGKLEKTNISGQYKSNLSNFLLKQDDQAIYSASGQMPLLQFNSLGNNLIIDSLSFKANGKNNKDTADLSLKDIKYNNEQYNAINLDSNAYNIDPNLFSVILTHLVSSEALNQNGIINNIDNVIEINRINTANLARIIQKGFKVSQDFSMIFPKNNNQKFIFKLALNLNPNKENLSNMTQDDLINLIYKNVILDIHLDIPVFLYNNLISLVKEQKNYLPNELKEIMPSFLEKLKTKNVIISNSGSYKIIINYKKMTYYINNQNLFSIISTENTKQQSPQNSTSSQEQNNRLHDKTSDLSKKMGINKK